jgi:hypothetical protein
MSKYFAPSELIINPDGSSFHLHLLPEHLAASVLMDCSTSMLVATKCAIWNSRPISRNT